MSSETGSRAPQSSQNPIEWLIRCSRSVYAAEDPVAVILRAIREASCKPAELEAAIGTLRVAAQRYLGPNANDGPASRCEFCGLTRNELGTLLVSAEGSICDLCAIEALRLISREPGHLHLRVAYFLFRLAATIGRTLQLMLAPLRS